MNKLKKSIAIIMIAFLCMGMYITKVSAVTVSEPTIVTKQYSVGEKLEEGRSVSVNVGEQKQLYVILAHGNDVWVVNEPEANGWFADSSSLSGITWSSSDKEVAEVSNSGMVTAKKAGNVTISAKCPQTSDYSEGTVTMAITVSGTKNPTTTPTITPTTSKEATGTTIPSNYKAFADTCHVAKLTTGSGRTLITMKVPYSIEKRKMNVKIGSVTDKDLLKKIKNNSGDKELLAYAKSNEGIVKKQYTANQHDGYAVEEKLTELEGKLTNNAYYYLYVTIDDENGKYDSIEAVTLAMASVFPEHNSWYLFFYGDERFKWNIEDDNTVANTGKMPETGGKEVVYVSLIAGVAVVAVAGYSRIKRITK